MATSDEQMSRHRLRVVVLFSSEPRTASETALVPPRLRRSLLTRAFEKTQDCSHSSHHLQSLFFFNKNSSLICLFYAWENSEICSPDLKKD